MLDNLKDQAGEFLNKPEVKENINKAKEFINSPKGQEYIEKAKDAAAAAKDKIEDFVEDKTDGKGILGFGAKK